MRISLENNSSPFGKKNQKIEEKFFTKFSEKFFDEGLQ